MSEAEIKYRGFGTQAQRAHAWDCMLEAVAARSPAPVNVKARENAWQSERAARDLRVADQVFRTPFNVVRKQG